MGQFERSRLCFFPTGLMAASLKEGGTSPLNRDLFIMMVAVGIMDGEQVFSRRWG